MGDSWLPSDGSILSPRKNVENLPSIESKFLTRHEDKLEELYQFYKSDGNISRDGFLFSLTGWKYCTETESVICEADARSVPIGRFIGVGFIEGASEQ